MKSPAVPPDEVFRLEALRALALLDTPPEPDFDAIVGLGRALFGVPTCLVSLIDSDRQWFKARAGLDAAQTPRDFSFCGHAILQHDVMVIPDARADDRFHDNPLVLGDPFIRFYAGAPIRLPSGYSIGTVCILSPEPRTGLAEAEVARLSALAGLVLNALAVRALRAELDRVRAVGDRYLAALHLAPVPIALADRAGCIRDCNDAFETLCQNRPPDGLSANAALPLPATEWAPAAMTAQGASNCVVNLPAGGARLSIHRDDGGFIFVAAANPAP